MSATGRVLLSRDVGDGLREDGYDLFNGDPADKKIALWQPSAKIEDITDLPKPQDMKSKAESFLNRAVDSCHLAAAPEWSYNITWLDDHQNILYNADSPLFILGCAPVQIEEMQRLRKELNECYDVFGEAVPDDPGKTFVTPTIIPIKASARRHTDKHAILIQYKNQPMGDGANPNERANLACGDKIWQLDPPNSPSLLVWTCSDLMDLDLRSDVERIVRGGNWIVHVQCNPKPFDQNWTRFRSGIFSGGDGVTYVTANWGNVITDIEMDGPTWGYSGVYAKTSRSSHLDSYDDTYLNNGLSGTKPNYYCEYVWTLSEDGVSIICRTRENNATDRAGQPSYANPHIQRAWGWSGDSYSKESDRVTECSTDVCNAWRGMLPDSPRSAELITSIALGEIDTRRLRKIESDWDLCWAALKTMHAGEFEEINPSFASHSHRSSTKPNPEEVSAKLKDTFDFAEAEANIIPADTCPPTNVPINAKDEDDTGRSVPISLSLIENTTPQREQKRIKWIVEWFQRREPDFKARVVTTNTTGGAKLKKLDRSEDVTKTMQNPEKIISTIGLVEVDK